MSADPAPVFHGESFTVSNLGTVAWADARAEMKSRVDEAKQGTGTLLFCEHPPTITRTHHTKPGSFISSETGIQEAGIDLVDADRGGDVTFHGPGQVIGYPVFQLRRSADRLPLGDYVRGLERTLVKALETLGVQSAHCKANKTGVWVDAAEAQTPSDAKVIAIGVGISPTGVTRHGFAINLSIDLESFTAHVVPCGLHDDDVTSLERLGLDIDPGKLRTVVASCFADEFQISLDTQEHSCASNILHPYQDKKTPHIFDRAAGA